MRKVPDQESIQHLKNLEIYGYTHVQDFAEADEVQRLLALVEHHYQKRTNARYKDVPTRDAQDKIIYNLQNKDRHFTEILLDPFIQFMCMKKLNDPYYRTIPDDRPNYILNYYNARSSGQFLDLHIDSNIPVSGPLTWSIQFAFVLEDQAEDNGCTVVVPGSHLLGRYTDRELENRKPILSKSGDLVIWDSRLWHGTLENKSHRSRWALIATFSSWWIKQTMDITRSLPDEIYQKLSDEGKALLGFCSIPPHDEDERILTKCGYDSLKPSAHDYY